MDKSMTLREQYKKETGNRVDFHYPEFSKWYVEWLEAFTKLLLKEHIPNLVYCTACGKFQKWKLLDGDLMCTVCNLIEASFKENTPPKEDKQDG